MRAHTWIRRIPSNHSDPHTASAAYHRTPPHPFGWPGPIRMDPSILMEGPMSLWPPSRCSPSASRTISYPGIVPRMCYARPCRCPRPSMRARRHPAPSAPGGIAGITASPLGGPVWGCALPVRIQQSMGPNACSGRYRPGLNPTVDPAHRKEGVRRRRDERGSASTGQPACPAWWMESGPDVSGGSSMPDIMQRPRGDGHRAVAYGPTVKGEDTWSRPLEGGEDPGRSRDG